MFVEEISIRGVKDTAARFASGDLAARMAKGLGVTHAAGLMYRVMRDPTFALPRSILDAVRLLQNTPELVELIEHLAQSGKGKQAVRLAQATSACALALPQDAAMSSR